MSGKWQPFCLGLNVLNKVASFLVSFAEYTNQNAIVKVN